MSYCLCDIEKVVYFVSFFFNVEEEVGLKGCSQNHGDEVVLKEVL